MERKIGEIKQVNGEWCQCVEGNDCANCVFIDYCKSHTKEERDDTIGLCVSFDRNDGMHVIFKKLEKVGEPYIAKNSIIGERLFQKYKLYKKDFFINEKNLLFTNFENTVGIEIKQKQEDMKEKNLNLKPFDLEAAKAGKPVCTRDGRKARIICFDFRDVEEICCLIAAIDYGEAEKIYYYDSCGKYRGGDSSKHDLMMLPEKKEGWVNIYKYRVGGPYESKEYALKQKMGDCIDTVKVEWEE